MKSANQIGPCQGRAERHQLFAALQNTKEVLGSGDAPASQWRPPHGSIEVVETKRMNHYDSLIWLDAYGFDGFECIFQRYPLKLHF